MRKFILNGIAVAIGTIGWITLAGAELSATRSVIAILGGELYMGTAVGHLNGAGTLTVRSRLDVFHGHGTGAPTRGPMSFTYGLTMAQSAQYLAIPAGKKLSNQGTVLALTDL